MSSIHSLTTKLQADYPTLTFSEADYFGWSHHKQTIYYHPNDSRANEQLLHEVAHAALNHRAYSRDISLLEMERDAWEYATRQLAQRYMVAINDDDVQAALDSYRDWLHARSTCPRCSSIGLEVEKSQYRCPACQHEWHVNEARLCRLKRTSIKK